MPVSVTEGYTPIDMVCGPFLEELNLMGLKTPTPSAFWNNNAKQSRESECPLTLLAQEVIGSMWRFFEEECSDRPTLGLVGRSSSLSSAEFAISDWGYSDLQKSMMTSRESIDPIKAMLTELSRQAVFGLEAAFIGAKDRDTWTSIEDSAIRSELTLRISGGINTASSYIFGAALLIERLVAETPYSNDPKMCLELFEQVKRFFRSFAGVSAGLENAFQKECTKKDDLEASPFQPLEFVPAKFQLVLADNLVIALKNCSIARIVKDADTGIGPRLGCPALFAGILPSFLDWATKVLESFYWNRAFRESVGVPLGSSPN